MTTKHTHTVIFGRRVENCLRCAELAKGATPIRWHKRESDDARCAREIRQHDCRESHCGSVCTFGEW